MPTVRAPRATTRVLRAGLDPDRGVFSLAAGRDIVAMRTGVRRFVVLSHPELADHVLHAGRDRYVKSLEFETLRAAVGQSLITDDGDSWRHHRSLLTPMFAKRRLDGLVDLMVEPIDGLATDLAERADRAPDGLRIDVAQTMVDVTLDVVGNALFGRDFSSVDRRMYDLVDEGMDVAERAIRVLMVAGPSRETFRRFVRLVRSDAPLPPGLLRSMRRSLHGMDEAIASVLAEREAHPTDSPDLLNLLLAVDDDGQVLPRRRVRDEALQFMLAGHETTANAMNWTWHLLARNPDARERLLAEVDEVLGGAAPRLEHLSQLKWTQACVEEAMRCYAPVPVIPRLAIEDDVIAGHRVRKGTTVMLLSHHIHHDPRWWPDPERYDPERFLGSARDRHRSAYLPFGGGRRVCIGRSFALMEMVLLTAAISRRVVLDHAPGAQVVPEASLTLRPRGGLPMLARSRGRTAS